MAKLPSGEIGEMLRFWFFFYIITLFQINFVKAREYKPT